MATMQNLFTFHERLVYRGNLQVKAENNKFYWRVDTENGFEPWIEIPWVLWSALANHYLTTKG